ncbi:MAG: XRE family transcriptional regulator [Bacteroidales bacterium]|jgi:phosphoribosyl-dephospho-CoA transferase|nr:XRE family transcriptional regulator [Bacteroidales bacterium]
MNEVYIGNIIKQKLKENGRSITWLAKKIYADPSNFSRNLKENKVDIEQLLKISKLLKVDFFAYYSEILKKNKFME